MFNLLKNQALVSGIIVFGELFHSRLEDTVFLSPDVAFKNSLTWKAKLRVSLHNFRLLLI